jgi:hypothetical protein
MTSHLNRSIQIHDFSLEPYYTNTWPLTWTVVYKYMTSHLHRSMQIHDLSERSCICILRFKWEVMYPYTTVQVSGHVFVYYGSSERSYICILRFKWEVMYLYTTVQVRGHVSVYYGSSERTCICILRFKWEVSPLTWTVVYRYMTSNLNCSIQIHDLSLES